MRKQLMSGFVALLVAGAAIAWLPSGASAQEAQGQAPAEVTVAADQEALSAPQAGDKAQVEEKARGDRGERTWRRKKRGFRGSWGEGEWRRRHHHHHRYYRHPGDGYRPGPGFWRGGAGPMGRPGFGRSLGFLMGRGPWNMEEIPAELKTPELEASIQRAREAEEAARSAAQELAKADAALMEARLQVMEQWLEAARAAGKITDERYERLRERHQRFREALERGPEAWLERWREGRSAERD